MLCVVYKSLKREACYLYVAGDGDLEQVPAPLRNLLGELEKVMDLDLSGRDRLALADIDEVRGALAGNGFYLQLPPGDYQPEI